MIVYALVDPRDRSIRYVGETVRSLHARVAQHLRAANEKTTPPVNAWIRGILSSGSKPVSIVIEELGCKQDMHDAEAYWIAQFRAMGADLLNIAPGGSTRTGYRHSAETRARWRAERRGERAPMFGKRRTEEQKQMFRELSLGMWDERPHPMLGKPRSEETKRRISESRRGIKPRLTPEGLERKREAARAAMRDPAKRAKMIRSGADNPASRQVVVDGVTYPTVRALAAAAGISQQKASARLKMYAGKSLTMADFTWTRESRQKARRQAEYRECMETASLR